MCELDAAERLFDELGQTNFSDASASFVCPFPPALGKLGEKSNEVLRVEQAAFLFQKMGIQKP
jgi:hypothetical protein